MEKAKFYATLIGSCVFSAVAGLSLGYFVFGPIGVLARDGIANSVVAEEIAAEDMPAYVNYDAPAFEEAAQQAAHGFIVTARDGLIVVYRAEDMTEIEITSTQVNALPAEEQERLARGIFVYTEEALVRILEDYGS